MRAGRVLGSSVVGLLCTLGHGARAASPPVKVALRSSWPSQPFLLELIETIALEDPSAYFPILDILTDPTTLPSTTPLSHEALHQLAFQSTVSLGYLSKPGAPEYAEMQLALHAATPKIEAFYQHYTDTTRGRILDTEQGGEGGTKCGSWVDWYGEVVCDVERLAHLAGPETIDAESYEGSTHSDMFPRPRILPFDHIYPALSQLSIHPPRTAIFHADLSSANFRELHVYLMRLSSAPSPRIEYVFRPIPPPNRDSKEKTYLSGYGVAMDLKKMDYLALDDRRSRGSQESSQEEKHSEEEKPGISLRSEQILSLIEKYPLNTTLEPTEPLTSDELMLIGFQATQLIADSPTPFSTLKELIQDFPQYATAIARHVEVSEGLAVEVYRNSQKATPGTSMVWLNGLPVGDADMNPASLLKILRKERDFMLSLTSLGLSSSQALDLISHSAIEAANGGSDLLDGLFDASDRPEDGDLILWWNDLEKDSKYARWPPSIFALMRQTYPGQMPAARLNLFNVVLVLDFSQPGSLYYIASTISNIIQRGNPIRFGVVPMVTEGEEGERMAKLIWYLVDRYGRAKTMGFLKNILQLPKPAKDLPTNIDWSLVRSEFESLHEQFPPLDGTTILPYDSVITPDANAGASEGQDEGKETEAEQIYAVEMHERLEKAEAYGKRLGVVPAVGVKNPKGQAFVNGRHFYMNDAFLSSLQEEVTKMIQFFQQQIYEGLITEETTVGVDFSTFFYDFPSTQTRRNKYVFPKSDIKIFSMPSLLEKAGAAKLGDVFVYPEAETVPMTIYVVADLDSPKGLSVVRNALEFAESSEVRLAFIHNPNSSTSGSAGAHHQISSLFSHLHAKSYNGVTPTRLLRALGLDLTHSRHTSEQSQHDQIVLSPSTDEALHELMDGVDLAEVMKSGVYEEFVDVGKRVVKELGLSEGEAGLVVNGRLVGPFDSDEFGVEDFKVLESYEMARRVGPVLDALESVGISSENLDRASYANLVSSASSIIANMHIPDPFEAGLFNTPPTTRNTRYKHMEGKHSAFEMGDSETALHRFAVVLDPLSEHAQRWVSLFEWMLYLPSVHVTFYIHPAAYNEIPLKRFYRYNLVPTLDFDENGRELPTTAVFDNLPIEPIYTLGLDEPSAWVVRPREALYDLDNIQLGVLSGEERIRGVEVVYELDYLVVGGHARDISSSAPPRGLQLQLTTSDGTAIADTLVAANLGYLQFKVTPGVYQLQIREGRGRDIFEMQSVGNEGFISPSVEEVGYEVTVTSFEGLTLYPRLVRKPGMQNQDVLHVPEEEEEPKGIVGDIINKVSSLFGSSKSTELAVAPQRHADINIFTVASGLLYERFASIMILSVLRNTNHTVKFWFIENFLSPSFLEFIPHFAEEYGFKYELVTYKWPTWLRAQREKQRIIWAYKILFLDVLFPMDLDKVIFVDADQIVRADLKELIDLDLHGAPYGYTPMGDDNTDMEGFRFWKTGYWASFLRGRPYHISALYVVDLVRFRLMAAGDVLRSHYHQLSADPNSLSNLDQDLPNNLQAQVPIYSLHEDWLWCETWCSKDRLDRAKTIDLCQNPLTKEPKLSRARQIPEWEEYDSEIARFTRKLAAEGRIHASAAAADINELANSASSIPTVESESSSVEDIGDDAAKDKEDSHVRDEL